MWDASCRSVCIKIVVSCLTGNLVSLLKMLICGPGLNPLRGWPRNLCYDSVPHVIMHTNIWEPVPPTFISNNEPSWQSSSPEFYQDFCITLNSFMVVESLAILSPGNGSTLTGLSYSCFIGLTYAGDGLLKLSAIAQVLCPRSIDEWRENFIQC